MVYYVVGGFILFDVLTGIIAAAYKGEMNSTKLREGLYHKASEVIAVAGAALLEYAMQYYELGLEVPMLKAVAVYICATELISVLENLCEINPTLYNLFKPFLEKLKPEYEGKKELPSENKSEDGKEDKE